MPIGTEREWNLQTEGDREWTLSLVPGVDGFDTSGAFDLIQRTRLADLRAGDDLRLDLNCSCGVSSFRHEGQYLVIDIADPDPNALPPADEPSEGAEPDVAVTEPTEINTLPDLTSILRVPRALPIIPASQQPVMAEPAVTEPDMGEGDPNPRIAEAAEIMAEQLARAAASGLLDAALDQPFTAADPVEADRPTDVEIVDPNPVPPEGDPLVTGDLPIRAETAFDRSIQIELPSRPTRTEGSCTGAPFSARDWADGSGFDQDLGALRLALYDERDVLSETGALQMAQHYLYYGFGAEAAYWLSELANPPDPYLPIASILDGRQDARFVPVEMPSGCSPGELLWRYIGDAVTADLEPDDLSALQRAFADLPPGLRDHLGPMLAARLRDDGHGAAALNIRDVLHRGGRIDPNQLTVLDLSLGISGTEGPHQTRAAIDGALASDGANSVTVMAEALGFERSAGTLPDPARVTAAEALLRENGEGPDTAILWREVLLAHAALGRIDTALGMLSDPARSDDARADALTLLIEERAAVNDTASLLILAYTYGRDWRPEGSAAGRAQVRAISALRAEGLFEAANILRDVRRPLILPNLDDEMPEAPDEALDAWQDGDWERLATSADGPHGDIAARMSALGRGEDVTQTTLNLADLARSVTDSRDLRGTITELLAQPTLP
ncbi:hypothetical protein [Hasllibacter sp. MH4015]|uniref:hypothetical protein n=1 Tax=Hasllibacter sp. MH4015 TaxID=2854029 RepID=UPI001CD75E10|nr:hypothetical protein [Hasllibacter sp. MH4015]